jgi:hypothetical protein
MNKELHVTSREFKMSVRNENELIQAGSMRKSMLGGISDMSLWRWLNDCPPSAPLAQFSVIA